ncbi:tyrosine-type recombinase/integrase [Rhodococcus daqingensis]|uniref:Tyrosine-type recombinase/integrase n=1 Tax=Rhodococcus daqingensis TaxID=2479363 RepID=A0ABW2S5K4_9NOCA
MKSAHHLTEATQMAGRPPLPLNSHGEISRRQLPDGRWRARCRFRGADGITRSVQRDSPPGGRDARGKKAEDALKAALERLVGDGTGGRVTGRTVLADLLDMHVVDLRDPDAGYAARTVDTYAAVAAKLRPKLGGLRVEEVTARSLGQILAALGRAHGRTTAKQAKTILSGMFKIAVAEGAVQRSPVRDIDPVRARSTPRRLARSLTGEDLATLIEHLRTSDAPLPPMIGAKKSTTTRTVSAFARDVDLLDPMVMLAGTGLRRSELLGLVWSDYSRRERTITVTGHVVRAGKTDDTKSVLIREEAVKTEGSARVIALPDFAVEMLNRRRRELRPVNEGVPLLIFPTTAGTIRDPDTFASQWRRVRGVIGFGWVGTHAIRKTVASLLDEAGLSARVAADVLGHARPSMTQDVYMGRGGVHTAAAEALSRVFAAH